MTPTPQPPEWAKNAFILVASYLGAHIEQNVGHPTPAECFDGASITMGGRIVMKAYEGTTPDDAKKPSEAPVVGINSLAIINHIATGNKGRVKDIAAHFQVEPETISALIAQEGSGLVVGKAGWVKLEGDD